MTFSNRNCQPKLPSETRSKPCDAPKVTLQTSATDYWSPPAQLRLDLLSDLSVTASVNDPNVYRIFDDEVAFLRNTIRAINARRNDITLMRRLPSETLAHVFYFLAILEREVALEHPKLWSIINLDLGKSWVSEMSTRAKQTAIAFKSSHNQSWRDARPLILPHWIRTNAIILSDIYRLSDLRLLTTPAPTMERIDLAAASNIDIMEFPGSLFANHAPLLRTASFTGFAVRWSSTVLHNLTSLTVILSQNTASTSPLPSYNDFFDALSNMPYLETLTNHFTLPALLPASSGRMRRRITLSHLSSLDLRGIWSRCMAILQIVEFPTTTRITLICKYKEAELSTSSLLPILERQSGKTGLAAPLRIIRMTRDHVTGRIEFYGWLRGPNFSSDVSSALIALTLQDVSPWPLISCDILRALFTKDTETLSLDADPRWNLAMFRDAVGRAQGLKRISLSESTLPLFCTAMKTNIDFTATEQTPANSYSECIPFPSLDIIQLHRFHSLPIPTLYLLTRVLKQRSALRSPIQEVDIIEWDPPEQWVGELPLRRIVPIVNWGREWRRRLW